MWEEFECSDPENFVPNYFHDVDYDYDTFAAFGKRVEKFKKDLKIFKEGTKESFYFAVLYGAFFKLDETKDAFVEDREVFESVLGMEFLNCIEKKKEGPCLDLNFNTFGRQCRRINDLLTEKKLFSRVYELTSATAVISSLLKKEKKKNLEKHLRICGSMAGLVYKFENQNISTFEDNITFMEDLPFSINFDLETTCGKKIYEFQEAAEMFPISYAFIVEFNLCLNLDRVFVVRSFNHTFMLKFFDPVTSR